MAAFEEATGGTGKLSKKAFVRLCQVGIQIELSEVELERIFDFMVAEGAQGLTCPRFCQTVRQRFFLRGVRRVVVHQPHSSRTLPTGYDLDRDTASNHDVEGEGFHGPFHEIRASRDHAYHGRYSRERQEWQDTVLESVVQRTTAQPIPWLVFTCGAMGVGKGYALGWMSSEGLFPLENIVHIDPDHFKTVMPEWTNYVEHGRLQGDPSVPGSMCHRESCYLQEIALEESMRRSQNIWVDGSLRNAEWFVRVFEDIRERFPAYRIAIFQVTAPEAMIRARVQERADRTGRDIPEALLMESLGAVERSVMTLYPHADFLASIDNGGRIPRLRYFSKIDRSGEWSAIQSRFARTLPVLEDFPEALAPFFVSPIDITTTTLELDGGSLRSVAEGQRRGQWGLLQVGGRSFHVMTSPAAWPTLRGEAREYALVPRGTASFVWIYPAVGALAELSEPPSVLGEEEANLLTVGGFAHFDVDEHLLGINAATLTRPQGQPALLQFASPLELSRPEAADLPASRWAPVTVAYMQARGARRFAFITPAEKLAGRRLSASGGFVYELYPSQAHDRRLRYVFFPVRTNLADMDQ